MTKTVAICVAVALTFVGVLLGLDRLLGGSSKPTGIEQLEEHGVTSAQKQSIDALTSKALIAYFSFPNKAGQNKTFAELGKLVPPTALASIKKQERWRGSEMNLAIASAEEVTITSYHADDGGLTVGAIVWQNLAFPATPSQNVQLFAEVHYVKSSRGVWHIASISETLGGEH